MDITEKTLRYLRAATGVKTSQDTAHNRKTYSQQIEAARVGGASGPFLDEPRFTVDCYAGTGADAYELAEDVAEALRAFPDNDNEVSFVEVTSIYRNEWTDGSPCYSVAASMVVNR